MVMVMVVLFKGVCSYVTFAGVGVRFRLNILGWRVLDMIWFCFGVWWVILHLVVSYRAVWVSFCFIVWFRYLTC